GRTQERTVAGRLDLYREAIAIHLAQNPDVDPIDLLASVVALAVGDEGPGARDDMDAELERARLAPAREERGDRPERGERRRPNTHIAGGPARWRVAVGHRDGVQPGALVGALTGEGGLTGKDVGKIDIFGSFSLVDIPGGLSPQALERLERTRVAGRPLRIR